MRVRDLTAIALKDIARQKVRSCLTVIALAVSSLILITMIAMSIGGQEAITRQFGSGDNLTTIAVTANQSGATLSPYGNVQQVNASASTLKDATVAQLLTIPHVASAASRAHLWELHHFTIEGNTKQFVVQGEGTPRDAQLSLKAGSSFSSTTDKNVVILGAAYANELATNPNELIGKTIQITTQKGYRGEGATIPGPFSSQSANEAFSNVETTLHAKIIGITSEGVDQNNVFLPLDWAQGIRTANYYEGASLKKVDQLNEEGYTSIQVRVDDMANVAGVSKAVEGMGYGQVSTLEQVKRVQELSTTIWVILGAVAIVATIAAALGVANTMLMAVSEQRMIIGVWRAVGARKTMIVRLFLLQAGLLGFVGGCLGVVSGLLVADVVNGYIRQLLQAQGLAEISLVAIPWWLMLFTVGLTTIFALIAGLYPSYKAARLEPSAALK